MTRAGVETFVADPARIGSPFRGEYYVCASSGTTGHPAAIMATDLDARRTPLKNPGAIET